MISPNRVDKLSNAAFASCAVCRASAWFCVSLASRSRRCSSTNSRVLTCESATARDVCASVCAAISRIFPSTSAATPETLAIDRDATSESFAVTSACTVRELAIASSATRRACSTRLATSSTPEIAVSAFCSAVRARCCATDKLLGEIVLCNRGEADHVRTVHRPRSNAAFGGILTCCTLTPGGTPNLRVEDAVSSTVLSAACGELTTTDKSGEFSVGDDIFTAQVCFTSLPIHRFRSLSSQHWASVDNLQLVGPDVFADVFRCLVRKSSLSKFPAPAQ